MRIGTLKNLFLFSFFVFPHTGACGGGADGEDNGGDGLRCEQLAARLCDEARSCQDENSCQWYYGAASANSLGRSCAVCELGMVDLLCEDTTKTAEEISGCLGALDQAICDSPTGGDGPGVVLPEECWSAIECRDGPCTG